MSRRRQQQQAQRTSGHSPAAPPAKASADADGSLFVLRVGERVVLDVLVDAARSSVMTFVRIDGELLAELPVLGQA